MRGEESTARINRQRSSLEYHEKERVREKEDETILNSTVK